MTEKEALKLALEALENSRSLEPVDVQWVKGKRHAAITALREALAEQPAEQPAQRPIKTFHDGKAWPVQEQAQQEPFGFAVMENPIAPPAQRTWVGLTDEDSQDVIQRAMHSITGGDNTFTLSANKIWVAIVREVEAKLKEKNT